MNITLQLQTARQNIDAGEFVAAKALLKPLEAVDNAEAIFLLSLFSVGNTESNAEFEQRSVDYLARSAELGYVPAMRALGTCYEFGDMVEKDVQRANALFKQAADAGDALSSYYYGRNRFYEAKEVAERREALYIIQSAAQNGVGDAVEFLIKVRYATMLASSQPGT